MAEKRMFSKTVIDSDLFLDMPLSAQAFYFHLSMRADDDGFVNNPKKIQRMIGASDDDAKLLIGKQFIIPFESGVVVIRHWKIHNYIQKDRYKGTIYHEEKALLSTNSKGEYSLDTECIQTVSKMDTQIRLDKVSNKVSIEKEISVSKSKKMPPTLEEVKAYCIERKNGIDPERFFDYYESNGWMRGKTKIKDWKACVRTWERNNTQTSKEVNQSSTTHSMKMFKG